MARNPEVQAIVSALVGSWAGTGVGGYPTIDPFEYRETTVIEDRPDHPALHYQQRAWKLSEFGEVASHWELGLIRISTDGTVTINNAQGGRAETMAGTWKQTDSGWRLELASTDFAGDDRVIASTRVFEVSGDTLSYEQEMKTTATNEMSIHLRASLDRQSDPD
ncbi:MAG: FABP family protein [Actinomycetota bacterium]|nr:FABP family protein [Actinomycetota bacterium]